MLALVLSVIGVVLSLIFLKYTHTPFVLIAAYWLPASILLIFKAKRTAHKCVWFNVAFIVLFLGAMEIYLSYSSNNRHGRNATIEGGSPKEYYSRHDLLGFAPAKNKTFKSSKSYDGALIYDVAYTIGEDGLRITPARKPGHDEGCVIFFGGSYTYGEGVNDHKAMPYVVGELQKRKVYNFGFPGYGPHQMLSAIENGMVDCKPRIAVYQMITNHVARAAGHPSWGRHGPKYILQNGRLKHDGHFDDGTSYLGRVVSAQLGRSSLYRRLLKKETPTVTDHDIQLFLEIVDASRRRLLEDYPGVEFHVILWDTKAADRIHQKVRDGLEAKSIRFHLVSDILPGFPKKRAKYEISAYDKHPNSIAHQLIAEYVVRNIIGTDGSMPDE